MNGQIGWGGDGPAAENRRLRNGIRTARFFLDSLKDAVIEQCEPSDGMCHGYDLSDDDQCALVADLERARHLLEVATR